MDVIENPTIDQTKTAIVNAVLLGHDLMFSVTGPLEDEDRMYWSIFFRPKGYLTSRTGLFRWSSPKVIPIPPEQRRARLITLNEALYMVDQNWERRQPVWA